MVIWIFFLDSVGQILIHFVWIFVHVQFWPWIFYVNVSEFLGKTPGTGVQRWIPSRCTRRDANSSKDNGQNDATFRKVRGWVNIKSRYCQALAEQLVEQVNVHYFVMAKMLLSCLAAVSLTNSLLRSLTNYVWSSSMLVWSRSLSWKEPSYWWALLWNVHDLSPVFFRETIICHCFCL